MTWVVALATVTAPLALLMGPAEASGGVQRYEMDTLSFSVDLHVGGGYLHDFTATINPTDGSFTGTGVNTTDGSKYETVTGTYFGGELSFLAYQCSTSSPCTPSGADISWWSDSPVSITNGGGSGTATGSAYFTNSAIDVSGVVSTTDWTHSQYVDAGLAAPQSCWGMPVQAHSNFPCS